MWEHDCGIEKKKLLKRSLRLNQYNKLTKTEWQTQFEIALASAVIGQEKSHHALDQSDARPKSVVIFPRF